MKPFESYLGTEDVRKTTPDFALARALRKDSYERATFVLTLPITEASSKILYENLYEALRQLADAIIILNGYKSYSHAASIAFLAHKSGFSETLLERFDHAREKRNKAKYYGKPIYPTDAEDIIKLYKELAPILTQTIDNEESD